jgi:hypothetical protein
MQNPEDFEENISQAEKSIKALSSSDINKILLYLGFVFDAFSIVFSFIMNSFTRVASLFYNYPFSNSWYLKFIISIIIGRVVYFYYYKNFKKQLSEFENNFTMNGTGQFLQSLGFKRKNDLVNLQSPEIDQFLQQNSGKLKIIFGRLGFLLMSLQALMFSAFLQIFLPVLISYLTR